jgi:hypothetical protein
LEVASVSALCKPFMVADGQEDWVELYRSALTELDHAQLPRKIDAANNAIQLRINELLLQKNPSQEHLQLEDALRNLRSLRRQTEQSPL